MSERFFKPFPFHKKKKDWGWEVMRQSRRFIRRETPSLLLKGYVIFMNTWNLFQVKTAVEFIMSGKDINLHL